MKYVFSILILVTTALIAATPVRVILFDTEAECSKFLLYLHANGQGRIQDFSAVYPEWSALPPRAGIPGYSADQWNSPTNCKHATSNLWAVPMNDRRIDAMIATHLFITNEFKLIWPTNGFQAIDSSFWDKP